MQQTLELVTENFHSLITHDYNADGISEILIARIIKNGTDIGIIHPKQLSNNVVRINERISTICMAQTSLDRNFELVSGDYKGVIRINSRSGKPFFTKDIKDGIRLPSGIVSAAPGDLNGNKLSEIVVGCQNGEVVMVERIPGKKQRWDQIRGFSLGKIFPNEVTQVVTGDFNGNSLIGFITASRDGVFKEIEFRPALQKFDLVGEFRVETEPSFTFAGDFDRDGITEVMVGEYSGRLSIFKRSNLMSVHNFEGAITSGTVADVDNDRQLEIVIGTSTGSFHILRPNTIESYEGYGDISDLKVGDLTGNRMNDLVFSIDKRRIIAFNFTRDKSKEKPNADLLPYGGYSQSQAQMARQQSTPVQQPETKNAFCPNCQQQVRFIEQYRRYYCYNCRQYVAPVGKKDPKAKQNPMIEPQAHGSPYAPIGTPYDAPSAYQPYAAMPTESAASQETKHDIEQIKSRVGDQLSAISDPNELEWQEETEPMETSEIEEYFIPLDLEADLDAGAEFFNDILKIKHVILIHSQSGVPLFSQGFGKEIDVSLTSGFLSAVGTFTEEMAGETEKRVGVFSEIGREGFWILIYEAHQSKAALLVSEKLGAALKQRITLFMKEFEQSYATELKNFNGFISAFNSATDILEKHLRIEYLYPLKIDVKRMRLTAITQQEKMIAKAYTDYMKNSDDEVFYVTELIDIIYNQIQTSIPKEDVLKILIKYLENGMLVPLPPPPEEPI